MNLRLTVSNIWKNYNGNQVLKDCSFRFEAGTYALMGSNGSGKSTFLRLCALLEKPDIGEINYFYGEKLIRRDIELRRRITLVLPKVGVFNTSVFKNVAYGLIIRGEKEIEIDRKVNKALEFAGLINKKNQHALTLSSGEIQRLGIARAIVIEPEILFLDEPTASVDEKNTETIEDIVLRMKKSGKSTVVIATHDRDQAAKLADRLIIIKDGKILIL